MRLITRSDLDGSVCAALLQELDLADKIVYIYPKDLQDNKIAVTEDDIIADPRTLIGNQNRWSEI